MIPTLARKTFWQVIQAFKRDPIYISKDRYVTIISEDGFIPVSRYSFNFPQVVEGEVGILGFNRLILKNERKTN
jgi:hypothetical protein